MLRGSLKRVLGVLALLAIAMQMVLSFAHTHTGAGQAAGFDAACFDNAGAPCLAPVHHPADHDQSEAACLICLAAHQTAATVLLAVSEAGLPELTASASSRLPSAPAHADTSVANFYARGPPAA